ncbi:hypothetical protein ACLOJK_023488 [Asimina triloba]
MSPVKSITDVGSAGSIGEAIGVAEGAASSMVLVSESVGVVAAVKSKGSFGFVDISIPSLDDLLGNDISIGNLNIDNVNQPFELPDAGMPEIEGPVLQKVIFASDAAATGDVGVALRNTVSLSDEVEPLGPEGGAAVEAVAPDAGGSGGNSSVGQHVRTNDAGNRRDVLSRETGTGESSTGPTPLMDMGVEFIETWWVLSRPFHGRGGHHYFTCGLNEQSVLFGLSFLSFLSGNVAGNDFIKLTNGAGRAKAGLSRELWS